MVTRGNAWERHTMFINKTGTLTIPCLKARYINERLLLLFCSITAVTFPSLAQAACGQAEVQVKSYVQAGDIEVRSDYTLHELAEIAGSSAQIPPHPLLGLYATIYGFGLAMSRDKNDSCSPLIIKVPIFVTKQIIQIAKEAFDKTCMRTVALDHYKLHARIQAEALNESSRLLQTALRSYLVDKGPNDVSMQAQTLLRAEAKAFVDDWLEEFQKSLPNLRRAADTPSEVQKLTHACQF